MEHVAAGVVGEGEAVSGVPPGLAGLDGILQAAGLPDDGHGAVAHGDHLAQAAGLALGGHEEEVRAGVNGHGQIFVIVHADGHPAGILLGGPAEEVLIPLVAGAQDHQLHGELHHIVEHLADQVQALVGDQAAYHSHNGGMGLFPQAHHPLELGFAGVFAFHILEGEILQNAPVGPGVVELHVDAVQHAGELVGALAHDALHPVGKVGHFQLVGVGGGDGVNRVGAEDGALEEVGVPVQQHGAVLGPAGVQAEELAQDVGVVPALILDVVDGDHSLDGAVAVFPHTVVLQVDGDQGGLPVVAVNDLGPEFEVVQHPHHGPGKESEALAVVGLAVEGTPVEVLLVVQEVPGHAVLLQGEEAAVIVPPGQVYVVVALEFQLVSEALPDPLVEGQDHGHLGALLRQGGGKGTGHVGEAAGFTEGDRFAGHIQDFHTRTPFHIGPGAGRRHETLEGIGG